MTSWRYEFKKGKGAELDIDHPNPDFCAFRNTLQKDHEYCGVEVYDIITGPIRNPMLQIFENHTKLSLISNPGVPEEEGICKYIHLSEQRYCSFCKQEASTKRAKMRMEKEMKKAEEIRYLFNNIHRIRGNKEKK